MTVLTLDGLESIRPGGAQFQMLKSPSALGGYIERHVGSFIISNVFGGQNPFDTLPNDVKEDIKGIQDTATTVAAGLTTALALGLIPGLVGAVVVAAIFVANAIVDGIQDANQVASDLTTARPILVDIPAPPSPDTGAATDIGAATDAGVVGSSGDGDGGSVSVLGSTYEPAKMLMKEP